MLSAILGELEVMGIEVEEEKMKNQVNDLYQTRPEMSHLHLGNRVYICSVTSLLLFKANLENHVCKLSCYKHLFFHLIFFIETDFEITIAKTLLFNPIIEPPFIKWIKLMQMTVACVIFSDQSVFSDLPRDLAHHLTVLTARQKELTLTWKTQPFKHFTPNFTPTPKIKWHSHMNA